MDEFNFDATEFGYFDSKDSDFASAVEFSAFSEFGETTKKEDSFVPDADFGSVFGSEINFDLQSTHSFNPSPSKTNANATKLPSDPPVKDSELPVFTFPDDGSLVPTASPAPKTIPSSSSPMKISPPPSSTSLNKGPNAARSFTFLPLQNLEQADFQMKSIQVTFWHRQQFFSSLNI